jgi:hypothetical protein
LADEEIELLKRRLTQEQQITETLLKQRNAAISEVVPLSASVPWFLWIITGAAAGVILTRGLR